MSIANFTFGADPEIFVKQRGNPVSAYGLVPGTKDAPHKTTVGAVQVDGMALEFNIDPSPGNDFDRFNQNIVRTIRDMRDMIGHNYSFSKDAVMDFDPEYLESQPPEAKDLGCDPDYNAYTGEENPKPNVKVPFRTGAGHLHFGWAEGIPIDNEDHLEICRAFVKMLDATVGLFMTYIDREPRRRELYGKAGAFRPKSYGVEYRTPSNAWIWNKDTRKIVHVLMGKAIFYNTSYFGEVKKVVGVDETELQRIINEGDWKKAEFFLNTFFRFDSSGGSWAKVKRAVMEKYGDNV